MVWFNYYKDISSVNSSAPIAKRQISKFAPKDTIPKGSWLYVDVKNLNINKKLSSTLEYVEDDDSYVIVYENENNTGDFTPVKTVIYGNSLYFQTAEEHIANQVTSNRYSLYYMTPGIRYLQKSEQSGITKYYLSTTTNSLTYVQASEIEEFRYNVALSSSSYYNFSFINSNSNWNNGSTNIAGSKAYAIFSGPYFNLSYIKSSDAGRFLIELEAIDRNYQLSLSRKSYIIDCYGLSNDQVESSFELKDLNEIDYKATITVLNEPNIKSSGNYVRLKGYSFIYNAYIYLGNEMIKDDISTIQIGASSAVSAVVGASSGDTVINNTYESVSDRDMKIRYRMEVL